MIGGATYRKGTRMWRRFNNSKPVGDCYIVVVNDYLGCETILVRDSVMYDVHMNIYQPKDEYQWQEVSA